MTAILFVLGCAGFAIVVAWAYGVAGLDAESSGVGLLAMVEADPSEVARPVPQPRWRRDAGQAAGLGKSVVKPLVIRPPTRRWLRIQDKP